MVDVVWSATGQDTQCANDHMPLTAALICSAVVWCAAGDRRFVGGRRWWATAAARSLAIWLFSIFAANPIQSPIPLTEGSLPMWLLLPSMAATLPHNWHNWFAHTAAGQCQQHCPQWSASERRAISLSLSFVGPLCVCVFHHHCCVCVINK